MRQLPDCLNRRYKALDELMDELGAAVADDNDGQAAEPSTDDPGIKLMCRFWNILKEDPDCNLQHAVQRRMELSTRGSGFFRPQEISCYMAAKEERKQDALNKINSLSSGSGSAKSRAQSPSPSKHQEYCDAHKKSPSDSIRGSDVPLSKVLCNLKEAASFDKKCSHKVAELKRVQKQVTEQIQNLEQREKEGVKKLKQADCMWSCMEGTYKQKISESIERQRALMNQQKELEMSTAKWRKNKKDLELQMKALEKYEQEIKDKINQKNNDIKCMDLEIVDLKKRIESNAKDTETAKKSLVTKKQASTDRMTKLAAELKRLQEIVTQEQNIKKKKEADGHQYVKEAREDLQKICRLLLQRQLENEDLKAETDAIIAEIELLKNSSDQCKSRCKNKQDALKDELNKTNNEIASFKIKCTQCHACVDTNDVRRFCTDCPKCLEERECIYKAGQCTEDPMNDCICMVVKQKFLDNVFENMYSVLERQSKAAPGKALAEQILECLKKSRNGKLNEQTRKGLQDFVLATVKKNLNLTIIGGAVKTRCEMDPDTYNHLMQCLKKLQVPKPEKVDQGTVAKKESCKRWGIGECNCPRGPKYCVCTRKAPPPAHDPSPCPQLEEDKKDIGEGMKCPHKEKSTCGPDCGNTTVPDTVKDLVKNYKPEPCGGQTCTFSKNMRAAQCVLGPESLNTISKSKGYMTDIPAVPNAADQMTCSCGCGSDKPCTCNVGICDCESYKNTKETREIYSKKHEIREEMNTSIGKIEYKTSENIKKETNKDISDDVDIKPLKDKDVPLVQAEVQGYQEHGTDPYITLNSKKQQRINLEQVVSSLTNEITPKDLFKVSMINDSGVIDHEFTEITTTCSGSIVMALNEKTIENIESSIQEDPNLFVDLKKTLSGHFVVDINTCPCDSSESRRIVVNKTELGNITMEVHRDLIDTIQPGIINSNKNEKNLHKNLPISIGLTKKKTERECNIHSFDTSKKKNGRKTSQAQTCNRIWQNPVLNKGIEEKKGHHDFSTHLLKHRKQKDDQNDDNMKQKNTPTKLYSSSTMTDKKVYKKTRQHLDQLSNGQTEYQKEKTRGDSHPYCPSLKEEFQEMIDINNTTIDVLVSGENGMQSDIKAGLTKTASGKIAVDIKAIVSVGQIANQLKEYPILLDKTNSYYLLKIAQENESANAVLRRSSSGGVYVVLEDTILRPNSKTAIIRPKQELFHFRVKGIKLVNPAPTSIMRKTNSGNYVFVLDKEFEKLYLQTVNDFVGDDNECYVNLSKTASDCYIIDFENNLDYDSDINNALIVKSHSGNIKLLVKGPAYDAIQKDQVSDQHSSNIFGELFKKLPPSSREFHREHLAKSKHLQTRSHSDSQLYDKIRIQDQKDLFAEPSAVLRKTSSGQYAVVLNKESKVTFINNLKSYISSSDRGLIPIEKTDEGDIIICLNRDHKGQYGSLKITPSGNIYVLVDENVIKEMEKDSAKKTAEVALSGPSTPSFYVIGTILNPQNKGVTTTCHAQPETCSCDASKCVCKDLPPEVRDFGYTRNERKLKGEQGFHLNQVKSDRKVHISYIDVEEYHRGREKAESKDVYFTGDESPKVTILHCSHKKSEKLSKFDEQCYYVIDTVHPTHEVPSDTIQLTPPRYKVDNKNETVIGEYDFEKDEMSRVYGHRCDLSNLDYLEYFPPQLPLFLRGYNKM